MKKRFLILFCAAMALASCTSVSRIDLSGTWQVSLDSLSTFSPIVLPGTTDLAGLGEPNRLGPSLDSPQIQRLTRKHSFLGEAFYRREFTVPSRMAGRPLELTLERVLWQSAVEIDGIPLPYMCESLSTPHRYLIREGLSEGVHTIMLRIDNRKRYDLSWNDLAHSYTNDTQVMWNGVLGEIGLRALDRVEIASTDIFPDPAARSIRVVTELVRLDPDASAAEIVYSVDGGRKRKLACTFADGDTLRVEYRVSLRPDAPLWDEFSPAMHTLTVGCGDSSTDYGFGLRDFRASGQHIEINGRRIFLRGTLDCCIFPLTGTPPLDEQGWEKEFSTCREWGFNHIRFHSWCPPDAAFRVADRMGFYLQVELPVWSKSVGDPALDAFMKDEYDRIVREYGNHPSFCMLSCGNELDSGYDFLNGLLAYMKEKDPRHIYTNSTYSMGAGHKGRPEPEDEYMVASRTLAGQIRGQNYLASRRPDFRSDYSRYASGVDIPLISHEIGQYSVYPTIGEIDKYTGTLDPLNLKGIRDDLKRRGLLGRAEDYTLASGRLAAILYKEEVERALKTRELSGFQMLGLQDFSGQSTALVGLVDAFWDSKGLVSPEWFRQACSPVVPLARFEKPCWSADEEFHASLEVASYWSRDMAAEVEWALAGGGKICASGSFKADIPTGGLTVLDGEIRAGLGGISCAERLELRVRVKESGGNEWSNGWNVWVYPVTEEPDCGEVVLARTVEEAIAELSEGGTVLLCPDSAILQGDPGRFPTVFWSPVFFPREAGTMGILCDPGNPALSLFPTEMHSDWQWWNLVVHSKVLDMDALPGLTPIVEAVDNFAGNRRLAYIFEAGCESGRLVFCAMDLLGEGASGCPEARQLLVSLLDYMNSPAFNPRERIGAGELKSFF